jgi:aromatic ring hydroxylase
MISLTDSEGRKFDRSIDGQTAKGLAQGNVDLFLQQVQPGLSVNGEIVFDIPTDAKGLKLIVKGSLFSGGTRIDLGK